VSTDEGFAEIKKKDAARAAKAAAKTQAADAQVAKKTTKDSVRDKLSEAELFKVRYSLQRACNHLT
jgi:hypothetical protein